MIVLESPAPHACRADWNPRGKTLPGRNCLGISCGQALSPIIGDSPINDGTAIDALPGVENEEEIRKPLQHHHAFTFRTFH